MASTGAAVVCGWFVGGPLMALACGAGAPLATARALRAARERRSRAVDAGAAGMARALADALTGGHSVRGAIAEAAGGLGGAVGAELRRVAHELALGARTETALEAMRERVPTHGIETIVAAALLQRGAGGDLARLLRDVAHALEDHARVEHDARAATAQARFTGLIVVLLPIGGGLLAELASPGYLMRLGGSFLTAWLGGMALVMQPRQSSWLSSAFATTLTIGICTMIWGTSTTTSRTITVPLMRLSADPAFPMRTPS